MTPHPCACAAALACFTLLAHAQPPPKQTDPPVDWRRANDTVGQYPRGHADVWRWEQAQPQPDPPPAPAQSPASAEPTEPAPALPTPAAAVRAAWAAERELDAPLARLGEAQAQRLAAGDALDDVPALQQRIPGVDAALALAAKARKAWLRAVAARQVLPPAQDALTAAESGAELARRMVVAGNWAAAQAAPLLLEEAAARQTLHDARLHSAQAERALRVVLGLATTHDRVALPDRLPEPAAELSPPEVAQRLAALAAHLPRAEARRAASHVAMAQAVCAARRLNWDSQRGEQAQLRAQVGQDALLRYNGMLDSVWQLLADAAQRARAQAAATDAQRDLLLAQTDLLWTLQGGEPQPLTLDAP